MSIKALQDYTYWSKYARYKKRDKRRENWTEAVERVEGMHLRKHPQVRDHIEWAFEQVRAKRVLGSQRALQFGGDPIERKNARLYNCTVSFCDRMRFFQECFWLLLCGCGTGFSVQKHHVDKLPEFHPFLKDREAEIYPNLNFYKGQRTFVIPDTIEGWADALGILLATYMPHPDYLDWVGHEVVFDYSLIRPAGSELASGVGKAPGSEPLKRSLDHIRWLIHRCVNHYTGMKKLRPIDAYDIVMHASDAVLSGGVRRSATICLFSPDDEEMAKAKTGNWFLHEPQRARSNNSALLIRDKTTKKQFIKLMESVKEFGEPGFVWSDSTELVVNPCFHRDTRILTEQGYRRIIDLYNARQSVSVVADSRVGKEDLLDLDKRGTFVAAASEVKLTQKDAAIFEVQTAHGHVLRVTENHEFPTLRGRLQLKDMLPGDTILLQSAEGKWGNTGTFQQGLILGLLTGDGCYSGEEAFIDVWEPDFDQLEDIRKLVNEEVETLPSLSNGGRLYGELQWMDQTSSVPKKRIGGRRLFRFVKEVLGIDDPKTAKDRVPECVWQGSRDFVRGYLQGLIFTDGTAWCVGVGARSTLCLRICQSNRPLLEDIQAIAGNFGVHGRIYARRKAGLRRLPDGKGGTREYQTKDNFELSFNRANLIVLLERIGVAGRKAALCEKLLDVRGRTLRKPERFQTKIKSVKFWGRDDVFCLKQFATNTVIANSCVVGNCVEIGMWPVHWLTGESGWQMCNLCEINGRKIKSKEDFANAAKAAAIIGTLQASYTDFEYLGRTTKEIVEREALLGVSITGMMDNPDVIFDPKIQRDMAKLVLDTNEWFAPLIGVKPCARATCVKPAGTTSCILGCASGIHPHHARRYFRRQQANRMEAPLQHFKMYNPKAVQRSVWSANQTDEVITFCVEVPEGARTKNQIDAITLLKHVKLTQQNWVAHGKRTELCTQPWLSHNVSNTINVKPDEWDAVTDYIYDNRQHFAGIALLPQSGDLDYNQAPMCTVHNAKELVQIYGEGSMFASGLIVDGLRAFDDLWDACNAVLGLGQPVERPKQPENNDQTVSMAEFADWKDRHEKWVEKVDWLRRAKQFAQRYFGDDVRQMTYCLKEVHNWHTWCELSREYVDIPWDQMHEEQDNTQAIQEWACSGGACCLV